MNPEPDDTNPEPTPTEGPGEPPDSASKIPLPRGINCCKCSYELHGLTRDARCPECATPIEDSLKSDALIFASPEYLRTLRIGAEMTTWGAVAWVLVALFWWALQLVLASLIELVTQTPEADLIAGGMVALIHFTTTLVLVRGIWLLTTREEKGQQLRGQGSVRAAARWILLVSYGLQEFVLVLALLSPQFNGPSITVIVFTLATNAIGWVFLLNLVARYYKRGRLHRLAWWSDVAAVTATASPLLILVFAVLTMMMPPMPGPILFAAGFAIGIIPLVVLILLGFTLLVSFIVFVELGSWINKARIRSEAIRAEAGIDSPFPF